MRASIFGRLSALLLPLLFLALQGATQVVQELNAGSVDWQQRVVRAKGIAQPSPVGGRAGPIRAARMDALRNILDTVEGMVLTAETTVEDFMIKNDRIVSEIRGVCRNFREVGEPVYISDGSLELTVEMILGPEFNDVLIGDMAYAQGEPVPVQYSDLEPGSAVYTGLIVDCSELGVRPAMAPRILDASGAEIYGNSWVDREWALRYGIVGYVRSLEQARGETERVGENPLLVRATANQGRQQSDVVIPDEDGKVLHALSENLKFLSECRVIFILG